MTGRALWTRLMCVAAFSAGLVGCAVLEIDVDVYKGPLANHEEVQVQQMTAMAVGAKPLLVQMRDLLQWPKEGDRNEARGKHTYKAEFVASRLFTDEQAQRVNAILSLYKDLNKSGLENFIERGTVAFRAYESAAKLLRPSPEQDEKLWGKLEKAMKTAAEITNPEKFINLKNEFHELLYPTASDPRKTRSPKGIKAAFLDTLEEAGEQKSRKQSNRPPGMVAEYHRLRDRERVQWHAKLLFRDADSDEAKVFVEEVVTLASSYFQAREAIHRMWETALKALIFIDSPNFEVEPKLHLIDLAAQLVTMLTQPQHLALITYGSVKDKTLPIEKQTLSVGKKPLTEKELATLTELEKLLSANAPNNYWENSLNCWEKNPGSSDRVRCWQNIEFDTVNETVQRTLFQQPAKVAKLFLQADEIAQRLARDYQGAYFSRNLGKLTSDVPLFELRLFGLARGPSFRDVEEELNLREVERLYTEISVGSALGFERGRLPWGIFTLIENYLRLTVGAEAPQLSETCALGDLCDDSIERARDVLLKALVRFSEKVLVVANNDSLIKHETNEGDVNRYVLVLQAVGNSILIQANELTYRTAHKDEQRKASGRENRAVGQAYSAYPRKVLDDLILAIGSDADLAQTTDAAFKQEMATLSEQKTMLQEQLKTKTAELTELQAEKALAEPQYFAAMQACAKHDLAERLVRRPNQAAAGTPSTAPRVCAWEINPTLQNDFHEAIDKLMTEQTAPTDLYDAITQVFIDQMAAAFNVVVPGNLEVLSAAHESYKSIDQSTLDTSSTDKVLEDIQQALREMIDETLGPAETAAQTFSNINNKILAVGSEISLLNEQMRDVDDSIQRKRRAKNREIAITVKVIERLRLDVILAMKDRQAPFSARSTIDELQRILEKRGPNVLAEVVKDLGISSPPSASQIEQTPLAPPPTAGAPSTTIPQPPPPAGKPKKSASAVNPGLPDIKRIKKYVTAYPVPNYLPTHALAAPETALDALDEVIAALRHEHIKVSSQFGSKSERALEIADALRVAYDHRSGMAYIRPSSAYLRSSYPSTSLQNDPGLAWQNMLWRHSKRSTPFFAELIVNPQAEKAKREIVADIDKQFWQTINRVRVAGAGRTNYVIAKDDIGNWYVKSYSADPKDIIESAKNLALFNLGAVGQLDTDLIARAKSGETGKAPPNAQRSSLQRLFDKHQGDYQTRTKEHFDALQSLLAETGVVNRIESAWSGIEDVDPYFKLDDLKTDLAAASQDLKPTREAFKDDSDATARNTKILGALRELRRFHNSIARKIAVRKLTSKPAKDLSEKEKSKEDATQNLAESEKTLAEKKAEQKAAEARFDDVPAGIVNQDAIDKLKLANEAVTIAQTKVDTAKTALDEAKKLAAAAAQALEAVGKAEKAALQDVSRILRDVLIELVEQRVDSAEDFETAVVFIGEATRPPPADDKKTAPAQPEETPTTQPNGGQ